MAGITKRDFGRPDDTLEFVHGRSPVVRIGEDEEVWRSDRAWVVGDETCILIDW